VSQVDADIKAVVQTMRKDYERPPMRCLANEDYEKIRHPDAYPNLTQVLVVLEEVLPAFGVTTLDEAGDGGAILISENTSMGRVFAAAAEQMGLNQATLHRTQTLPESIQIVNASAGPAIVVRTEVLQQLVHAEVGFFFAYALELAKPGHRLMASLLEGQRSILVPALWLALGFKVPNITPSVKDLAHQIREATNEEMLAVWAEDLQDLRDQDPAQLGHHWWEGVCHTARRAGLIAGPDLRQIFRVMSRIEYSVPRPRVVARLDELDDYITGSRFLRDLLTFSCAPNFGSILSNATIISES
jgi:hypothetical protein